MGRRGEFPFAKNQEVGRSSHTLDAHQVFTEFKKNMQDLRYEGNFLFNGLILRTRTRQAIRSEEETTHLLFVAAIPLGRFHRHEISKIVV